MGVRTAAALRVRLLLDEMHSPAAAVQLRDRGHDVVAVKDVPGMAGLPDRELLAAATADLRAVVTENVADFAAIHRQMLAGGENHAGIVFTHPRRFPRHAP